MKRRIALKLMMKTFSAAFGYLLKPGRSPSQRWNRSYGVGALVGDIQGFFGDGARDSVAGLAVGA